MIRFLATALGSAIVMALWLAVREERVRQADTVTPEERAAFKVRELARAADLQERAIEAVTEHDGTQWTWTTGPMTSA